MRFILFTFSLFLTGFIFSWLFSLAVGPVIMAVGAVGAKENSKLAMPLTIVLMIIGFVIQLYVILWWDAYVLTKTFIISYDATYRWLYVTTGFICAVGPLGYMASKEANMNREAGEQGTGLGTCLFLIICMAGYWVFYFFPSLMLPPYGWFLRWWFGKT